MGFIFIIKKCNLVGYYRYIIWFKYSDFFIIYIEIYVNFKYIGNIILKRW